ncbi:MAG: hypothetical protein ACFFFC_04465 [Candidatus Thorarchaeota archaeon]
MIKVLYVWNTAGTISPVATWLNDHGHEARIIMHSSYDKYGATRISKGAVMINSRRAFYWSIIKYILLFRPTHIHVNASIAGLVLARLFAPTTPIILQYHGNEVRFRSKVHPEALLADKVIVSTPDLKRFGEWVDRPVESIFYYRGGRKKGTALMVYASYFPDKRALAKSWCAKNNIKLRIYDRDAEGWIPFEEFPSILSKYEYYLDWKGISDSQTCSKTALEAMACGCKVITDYDVDKVLNDYNFATPKTYIKLYLSLKKPLPSIRRTLIAIAGIMKWFANRLGNSPVPSGWR